MAKKTDRRIKKSPFYIAPIDLTPGHGPKRQAKMKAEASR